MIIEVPKGRFKPTHVTEIQHFFTGYILSNSKGFIEQKKENPV
jgi:hypothetical protein